MLQKIKNGDCEILDANLSDGDFILISNKINIEILDNYDQLFIKQGEFIKNNRSYYYKTFSLWGFKSTMTRTINVE